MTTILFCRKFIFHMTMDLWWFSVVICTTESSWWNFQKNAQPWPYLIRFFFLWFTFASSLYWSPRQISSFITSFLISFFYAASINHAILIYSLLASVKNALCLCNSSELVSYMSCRDETVELTAVVMCLDMLYFFATFVFFSDFHLQHCLILSDHCFVLLCLKCFAYTVFLKPNV